MSDISKMTDKQLRNEVQLLRDELAIMKRKYEDIIYNLDTDNFSSRFVKEQGDMKTAIEVTAKGIEAKVSNEEFQSKLSLTAKSFETSISDLDSTLSSKITQSAETIKAEVKQELEDGDFVTKTTFGLTTDELFSEVSRLDTRADNLSDSISSVRQTANSISTKVTKITNGKFTDGSKDSEGNELYYTLFTQDAEKFTFQGDYMDIQSAIRLTDNYGNHAFSIFHQQSDGNVYMWGMGDYSYKPLVIGSKSSSRTQGVYLYDDIDANLIATRGWVEDHAGSGGTVVARFG